MDLEVFRDNIDVFKDGISGEVLDELLCDYKDTIINSNVEPFGLSAAMFNNKAYLAKEGLSDLREQ